MPENTILLKNTVAVLPSGEAAGTDILVRNGRILHVSPSSERRQDVPREEFDLAGRRLYAGFIDIHNHGAVGIDVNEATVEGLLTAGRFLATRGVTSWLPTFVPDSEENYRKAIRAIEEAMKIQAGEPAAQIVGVHYEGVFANSQMCGALRPQYFRTFTGGELGELPRLSAGAHLTTFAPEIEGGIELVAELKRQNWIPSIGHTMADVGTLERAFEAGARHITHFFNAMTGLHHRDVGVAGWALGKREVSCDIIADGIHVAPAVLKLAFDVKSAANLMLISDSVAPTGLGDGNFELWDETVSVAGGRTRNERGSIAGSVITMLDAVKMYLSLGVTAGDVSLMASANPARLLGLGATHGSIEAGKRADLVALDGDGGVAFCLIGGNVAFERL
jgi:N-acetylglucosamine-6-phosphate deacetylase